MKPFRRETGVLAPMPRSNVDTDQIIPKQFLKRIERTGFGPALFFDWRYDGDGAEWADFVLNREPFRQASVLVGGRNFGCGSSREHAVWALQDFGFRAVIAPSFADIFRGNSGKAGLLTVALPEAACAQLADMAEEAPGLNVTVDLEACEVVAGGQSWSFEVDAFTRHCLLEGLDDIALTLRHEADITAFEARRPIWFPDSRRSLVAP
ncbi:MAG TPA: 3-isopropylmalate dehydratase small subunit [Candidatus Dormibacteraeota bacterium]|jgi:3-isopropylmalate/(R)-2-methylmalate dehydratase small subunit|nr:3-isopropylmalate dehydratase small subunit [Candidatus Dormibacteraeota bacterium]